MATWGLMTGTVQVLGSTYEIATSKALRVGDEVLVARNYDARTRRESVSLPTPSEAQRLTDTQRLVRGVTVLTVAEVNRKTWTVRLAGADAPLNVSRTSPCVRRIVRNRKAGA